MINDDKNRKSATFSIRGVQRDIDGEESVIELITEGDIIFKDDCVLLKYEESEFSGMFGVTTNLEIRKDSVSMVREGSSSVEMFFEKGKQFQTRYNTPYGGLSMQVFGSNVDHKIDECGGFLRLDYILAVEGANSVSNSLCMDIKVK